jgi:hypothetical protein
MSKYQNELNLFINNIPEVKKAFKWQDASQLFLSSLMLTSKGINADEVVLKETRKMFDKNTSLFSNLKYHSATAIVTLLSQTENPLESLQNIMTVQALLKKQKFYKDDYEALVATQIALNVPADEYEKIVILTGEFYQAMKERHKWITNSSDYIYACSFAMAGLEVAPTMQKMEELMTELAPHFKWTPNSRQTLAQILILGDAASENTTSTAQMIERIVSLQDIFKARKLKVDYDTIAIFGLLAMLPVSPEEVANQIATCYDELRAEKAFGKYNGKQVTLMLASSIVSMGIANEIQKDTNNSVMANFIINLIIQQEMTMIMLATTAAVISTSTNN